MKENKKVYSKVLLFVCACGVFNILVGLLDKGRLNLFGYFYLLVCCGGIGYSVYALVKKDEC